MQAITEKQSHGMEGAVPLAIRHGELQRGTRELRYPHVHLVFVSLGGGVVVRSDARGSARHRVQPGSVALHPAGHAARWQVEDPIAFSVLSLDAEFANQVARDSFGLAPEQATLDVKLRESDPTLAAFAGAMASEGLRRDAGSRMYVRSMATLLALHLLREYVPVRAGNAVEPGQGVGMPRAVARAVAFMRENFSREIGLQDVADAVHVSGSHLTRLFRRALGVTPYRYLLQMRVENARSLLAAGAGRRSLAEIASAVGFCDQSHLTRHCKRLLGATPGQLQARLASDLIVARPAAA
ncbi:MAG: AraC family transcriptional regulator [Burkholderiales bacterium]